LKFIEDDELAILIFSIPYYYRTGIGYIQVALYMRPGLSRATDSIMINVSSISTHTYGALTAALPATGLTVRAESTTSI
jgi:hypothetical protein